MTRELDLFAEPAAPVATAVHTCGECVNIKPTKHRRYLGVGFFCTESYDDVRPENPACDDVHFQLRIGPCEGCGPVCDAYPCSNADPKESVEIATAVAKE
jgi:hypothetical protein